MAPRPARLPLRVVIVSDAESERNGVGTYYHDLAEHLATRVDTVTLICPQNNERALKQWLKIPLPGDTTQRLALPSPVQLRRRLRELRPHTVIIATPGPYGLIGAYFARRLANRLIFGLHTHYEALSSLYWGPLIAHMNRACLAMQNRLLARQADHVVANSPAMCTLGHQLGSHAVSLVGTLVPEPFLSRPPAPFGKELRRILFVGRLAAEKRVDTVLDSAAKLPHIHFRIAGDGPQRDTVAAAARCLPNLEYLGWLRRSQVLDALDECDMLVLPSRTEAFGTVALEALARGRVTLVSQGCGIAEWSALSSGLYRFADDEPLVAAIQRIAAQAPEARRARATHARHAVADMVQQGVRVWLDVLAGTDKTAPASAKAC